MKPVQNVLPFPCALCSNWPPLLHIIHNMKLKEGFCHFMPVF